VQTRFALTAFHRVVRSEGVRGLYRGFGAALVTYVPLSASAWSTYEASKRWIVESGATTAPGAHPLEDRVAVHAAAGIAAGIVSTVVTHPLDLAKTRIQTQAFSRCA
jgi:solute carrier family 25 protein 44